VVEISHRILLVRFFASVALRKISIIDPYQEGWSEHDQRRRHEVAPECGAGISTAVFEGNPATMMTS